MPTLQRFNGFKINMYADHNPPHVHVVAVDWEAKVELETGIIMARTRKTDSRRINQAVKWIAENSDSLLKKWMELNG